MPDIVVPWDTQVPDKGDLSLAPEGGSKFHIYFDSLKGYAKVHLSSCRHCKTTPVRGRRNSRYGLKAVGRADQWIPADSVEDALARWRALGSVDENRPACEVCRPFGPEIPNGIGVVDQG